MSNKTVQMRTKDFDLIEIAKEVFIKHHPYFEMHLISNRKIIFEALKYYIKTEKEFEHKIQGDKYLK